MSMITFILGLVLSGLSFISFLFSRRKPTKMGQRITCVISIIVFVVSMTLVVLSYWASIENEDQLQLAHDQASEAIVRADRAQTQITEIRTPRRMEPETKRMLAARMKPYAGQKFDMKVFRDQDSLELIS